MFKAVWVHYVLFRVILAKTLLLWDLYYIYLLLTEFSPIRSVLYVTDQVFSPSIHGPSAKRASHKSQGAKRGSVTYSTDREDEVSKIFIISLLCV